MADDWRERLEEREAEYREQADRQRQEHIREFERYRREDQDKFDRYRRADAVWNLLTFLVGTFVGAAIAAVAMR